MKGSKRQFDDYDESQTDRRETCPSLAWSPANGLRTWRQSSGQEAASLTCQCRYDHACRRPRLRWFEGFLTHFCITRDIESEMERDAGERFGRVKGREETILPEKTARQRETRLEE